MPFKYKNGSECKYCKIGPNKQCIFCDPHVNIIGLSVEFCCTPWNFVENFATCYRVLLWNSSNNMAIKTHQKTTKKAMQQQKTNKSSREKKEGEEKGGEGKEKEGGGKRIYLTHWSYKSFVSSLPCVSTKILLKLEAPW